MQTPNAELLSAIANRLRILSIQSTTAAKSGHPTSAASAADLVAALFFHQMRFDPTQPKAPFNDRFILSKGHAAPLLYAAWAETGHFPESQLNTLRQLNSDLEGHPTPRLDFVDVATGSLGQGLSVGVGMALEARMDGRDVMTYVLMGDGEMAEGSVWEAISYAAIQNLIQLVAIVDVNRLGQNGETAFGHHMDVYQRRFEAFGWNAVIIDGHDMRQILGAMAQIDETQKPLAILARTIKGQGILEVEDKPDWHGKPLKPEMAKKAIDHLRPLSASALDKFASGELKLRKPSKSIIPKGIPITKETFTEQLPYKPNQKVAVRKAFGNALVRMGAAAPNLVVIDGDVGNSTYTNEYREKYPDRFIEAYIAEQNMIGMATGLSARGKTPCVSTFAAFLERALDQIRIASLSLSNLKLTGTHPGVSIGDDGASQMGLEDVAAFRAIHGLKIFYPCDAVSAERLTEIMIREPGMFYLRATRADTPILYRLDEKFEMGGAKILRQSDEDRVTVIAAGITVFQALKAYEDLLQEGVHITVIDAYSIKPLAKELILDAAEKTRNWVITVEDHNIEGGLGDAVAGDLSFAGVRVSKLAVCELAHSGKPEELLAKYRIDHAAIVDQVKVILASEKNNQTAA